MATDVITASMYLWNRSVAMIEDEMTQKEQVRKWWEDRVASGRVPGSNYGSKMCSYALGCPIPSVRRVMAGFDDFKPWQNPTMSEEDQIDEEGDAYEAAEARKEDEAEKAKPAAAEKAKPAAAEKTKPAAEKAKPAAEKAKPAAEKAKPAAEKAKPAAEKAKPAAAEKAKPADGQVDPAVVQEVVKEATRRERARAADKKVKKGKTAKGRKKVRLTPEEVSAKKLADQQARAQVRAEAKVKKAAEVEAARVRREADREAEKARKAAELEAAKAARAEARAADKVQRAAKREASRQAALADRGIKRVAAAAAAKAAREAAAAVTSSMRRAAELERMRKEVLGDLPVNTDLNTLSEATRNRLRAGAPCPKCKTATAHTFTEVFDVFGLRKLSEGSPYVRQSYCKACKNKASAEKLREKKMSQAEES